MPTRIRSAVGRLAFTAESRREEGSLATCWRCALDLIFDLVNFPLLALAFLAQRRALRRLGLVEIGDELILAPAFVDQSLDR